MKKRVLVLITLCTVLLTGCGVKFDITPTDLQAYAIENDFTYADVTDQYGYSYLDGVYVIENSMDDVHIELWDFDNIEDAHKWFEENINQMKGRSNSFSGYSAKTNGEYDFVVSKRDMVYHILFSGNKGIYASGHGKNTINKMLIGLHVMEGE